MRSTLRVPSPARLLAAVAALLALPACGGGDETPQVQLADHLVSDSEPVSVEGWKGRVIESSAGAPTVVNPAAPLVDSARAVPERLWHLTLRAAAIEAGGGRVYVLDPDGRRVHIITGEGARESTVATGLLGLSGPARMGLAEGELLLSSRGVVQVLTPEGESKHSVRAGFPIRAMVGLERGSFLAHEKGARWRLFERTGTDSVEIRSSDPGERQACRRLTAGGGRLLLPSCSGHAFQVMDARGTFQRAVEVDRPLPGGTMAELEAYRAGLSPQVKETARARAVPTPRPESVRAVRFDPGTGLYAMWEQPSDSTTEVGVFTAEGVYLAALRFPGQWADFAFGGGQLYVIERSPEGRGVGVTAWRIRLPAEAPAAARRALSAAPVLR